MKFIDVSRKVNLTSEKTMITALFVASCNSCIFVQNAEDFFNSIQNSLILLAKTATASFSNFNESWLKNTWSVIFEEISCIKKIKKISYCFESVSSISLRTSSCVKFVIYSHAFSLSLDIFWFVIIRKCLRWSSFIIVNALSMQKVVITLWFEKALIL
jgi:hypothetical protein